MKKENPIIECACGCGSLRHRFDNNGREHLYIIGHDKKKDIAQRLWSRVEKKPSGCWEWTGALAKSGYGVMTWNRRVQTVHRIAYILMFGEIPPGLFVCHHCDNRKCVHPDHLFLGTNTDDDMIGSSQGQASKIISGLRRKSNNVQA